ncbi:MAG: aldolase catalytic domain-containing protein [Filimonas sp.]|nr:aldolase catalytic domain-containing protein [Filimonas sp.]
MKILDCTLRDGGYYTNWNYQKEVTDKYFSYMNKLPIDYVEIGYRSIRSDSYLGEFFYTPPYILEKANVLMPDVQKVIMLDEKDTQVDNLDILLNGCRSYVKMVRIAMAPNRLENGVRLADKIKEMGFEVAFNVMYASKWLNDKALLKQLKEIKAVDYLYLVDSYGSLYPEEVRALVRELKDGTEVPLGFHGHNNLELALINSLTAAAEGCEIIDATVTGMGRGAGNLKTELFLTALNDKLEKELDLDSLAALTEVFYNLREKYKWGTNLAYMLAGQYSIPQNEVMSKMGKRRYAIGNIIRQLLKFLPSATESHSIKAIPLDTQPAVKDVFIIGGGKSVTEINTAFDEILRRKTNNNEPFAIIHSSSRYADVFAGNGEAGQYFCLFGNEGKRFQSFPNAQQMAAHNKFIIPAAKYCEGIYMPSFINDHVYDVKDDLFEAAVQDSPLALSLQAAAALQAKNIYLIGFDGYVEEELSANIDLLYENQGIIDAAQKQGLTLKSLTPTRYSNIEQLSIFRFLY